MVIVIMVVGVVLRTMIMMVGVVVIMVPASMMIVRGDGVGDQMEEGITQQSSRGKAEQDLEKGGVVLGILQRDAEEDKERGSTDECCGDEGVGPELPGGLEGGGELEEEPPWGNRVVSMSPDH